MTSAEDPIDAEVVESAGAQIVQLHKNLPPAPDALKPVRELEPSTRAREVARRVARPLPGPRRMARSTGWWLTIAAKTVPWLPVYVGREFKPIGRGLGIVMVGWAHWVKATSRHSYAREAEGNKKATLGTAAAKAAAARTWATVVFLIILVGVGVWAWNTHPGWVIAAAILLLAVLDVLGRADSPQPETMPAPLPMVLTDATPLPKVAETIIAALHREGFPEGSVGVAEPLWWDETRRQYEMSLSLADQLRPEHVRAIERAIGARDHAVRNLATATATIRKLIIAVGDPLAGGQVCSWIDTGSLTFTQPLPLGRSAGETPMEIRFLGAHVAVVGRTRAGKTEGFLWTLIDRLATCRDVVIWGIDLQAGPAFPLWRKVIQKVAYDPDDALILLEAAIGEMRRRKKILTALAESDDEEHEDAGTVWTPDLGNFLVIIIDEFALTATYNGEKGKTDLMAPLEEIIRTGLKFGVHLVLATQKTGNSDFGSSVMQTQIGIKILLACHEPDTVRLLSTEHRDAGYSPHLLKPAQGPGVPNDAGKCYIDGPDHRTPDVYRSDYWPDGTIKARARARLADGLPTLDGAPAIPAGTVEAVEVPPILATVEAAFQTEGDPERLSTADLLDLLRADGWDELDENKLAAALRSAGVQRRDQRWRPAPGVVAVRGYWLADVQTAIRRLS